MAVLRVKNLRFLGLHGHLPEEKIAGNRFEIDVEAEFDLPATDDLDLVPDYSRIARRVRDIVHGPSAHLIETLAARLLGMLRTEFSGVRRWRVTVRKLQPPMDPTCDYTEIDLSWPGM